MLSSIIRHKNFVVAEINNQLIVVKGIGKMFYQEGYPISLISKEITKKGYTVSWLHVADELQKNGWKNKTIISKLREEFIDTGDNLDLIETLELFLNSSYEDQREMISQYLFNELDKNTWLKNTLISNTN